jgi:hypothetical protein
MKAISFNWAPLEKLLKALTTVPVPNLLCRYACTCILLQRHQKKEALGLLVKTVNPTMELTLTPTDVAFHVDFLFDFLVIQKEWKLNNRCFKGRQTMWVKRSRN